MYRVYLMTAATCSHSVSLELLLSSAASHNPYRGYHYIKYQLPTGPMHPSSHDLPWLSKPLVLQIYPSIMPPPHKPPQGILPSPNGPRVTLALPPDLPSATPGGPLHTQNILNTPFTMSV